MTRDIKGRFKKEGKKTLTLADVGVIKISLRQLLEEEGFIETPKPVASFDFPQGVLMAGRYQDKPEGIFGVNLTEELWGENGFSFPIKDFSIPTQEEMRTGVAMILALLREQKVVYMGCLGGQGRTGMVLACIVKVFNVEKPIQWVRGNYKQAAVETPDQEKFISNFDAQSLEFLTRI